MSPGDAIPVNMDDLAGDENNAMTDLMDWWVDTSNSGDKVNIFQMVQSSLDYNS